MYDYQALSAVESAMDYFTAQQRNRLPRDFKLEGSAFYTNENIIDNINALMKILAVEHEQNPALTEVFTIGDVIEGLKTVKSSIGKWTKMNGRKGYLNYISNFFL
ncbi:MAG: hypothetical protein HYV28_07125 [Ignavibacteriales bacterium]|nr:hypothetical protein [Ignavibacteriales bacterium]